MHSIALEMKRYPFFTANPNFLIFVLATETYPGAPADGFYPAARFLGRRPQPKPFCIAQIITACPGNHHRCMALHRLAILARCSGDISQPFSNRRLEILPAKISKLFFNRSGTSPHRYCCLLVFLLSAGVTYNTLTTSSTANPNSGKSPAALFSSPCPRAS